MKDLGEVKKIIGMEITRNREKGLVWLTQKKYLKKLLQKFEIHNSTKPISSSLANHLKLGVLFCPKTEEKKNM